MSLIFSPGSTNDLIVEESSQRGGLTGQHTTMINDQMHLGSPENSLLIGRLFELLKAHPSSSSFSRAGFNPPVLTYNPHSPLKEQQTSLNASIKITTPSGGASFVAGSTIPVSFHGAEISEIRTIVSYNYDSVYVSKSQGTSNSYSLSIGNQLGKRTVIALGKTVGGGYVSDTTTFYVISPTYSCASLRSGGWTDTSIWSCGRVPTANDIVTVNPSHKVSVSTMASVAKGVILEGGTIEYSGTSSSVFIKGAD